MSGSPTKDEIEKHANFWDRSAADNFKAAEAMLRSKRYNFVMFMCQQAIEAMLKCAFVRLNAERPAHVHKLPRLLTLTGMEVPSWIDRVILRVDAHYIKARYFEDRFDRSVYNRKNASAMLQDTKKVLAWFAKELNSKK